MIRVLASALTVCLIASACTEASDLPASGNKDSAQNSDAFDAMSAEEHLSCAAMISAYDQLIGSGVEEAGENDRVRRLNTSMWHLNAYAIPQEIGEADAFVALDGERSATFSEQSDVAITKQAKACMDVVE